MNVISTRIFILLLLPFSVLFGQEMNYSTAQLKELARSAEEMQDYATASVYYEAFLTRKPQAVKLEYALAECYRKMGAYQKALPLYRNLAEREAKRFPLAAFYYAESLKAIDSCKQAIPVYEAFRKAYRGEKEERKYRRLAKFQAEGCQELNDSASYIGVRPLDAVNSNRVEGAPIFLGDGKIAYNRLELGAPETVEVGAEEGLPIRRYYQIDYQADSGQLPQIWDAIPFEPTMEVVNGAFNPEGNRFYFTVCQLDYKGEKDCDLYFSEKQKVWEKPKKLPEFINTTALETQPAVGVDEKGRETIYFVSDRKEGKGGKDIWYTRYDPEKESFKTPRNCGSKINSVGDEITPFIHPLSGELLFSSDGHPGFGLFDVFKSSGQRSRWTEPLNLGASINGAQDEVYYVVHANGQEGLFASNRPHPKKVALQACCDDLFYFNQAAVDLLKLKVRLNNEDEPDQIVQQAKLNLYTKDKDGELYFNRSIKPDDSGNFDLLLEKDKDYVVKTRADDYLNQAYELEKTAMRDRNELELKLALKPISDRVYEVENIYYDFADSKMMEEAYEALDTTLLIIMQENPEIIVEIGSHTDSVGSAAYNQNLSQKRAQSVVNYLKKKGIDRDRLRAKGYGESQPVAPNTNSDGTDNPEGRAKNRRTEFKVIGKINLIESDD